VTGRRPAEIDPEIGDFAGPETRGKQLVAELSVAWRSSRASDHDIVKVKKPRRLLA
jgi:hypothetical protein